MATQIVPQRGVVRHVPVERATTVAGIARAFRPEPLTGADMAEFYSDALDRQRGNSLGRRILDDINDLADVGYFFQGVLYGNRGSGKSTEINRMLEDPGLQQRFLIVRMDATAELNPQTFSVADVLLLLFTNLIEACEAKCGEAGRAFNEAGIILTDLQQVIAPFFPELQAKVEQARTTGGGGEVNLLQLVKLSVRVEGQRKTDIVNARQSLTGLAEALDRLITAVNNALPGYELLVIGENFDKASIKQSLLEETFVQYSGLWRDLRLHLLFTLPVAFVHANGAQLIFRRESQYAIYDIPVVDENHAKHEAGCAALMDLIGKRCDTGTLFEPQALEIILRASGGDLYGLFALIINAGRNARYRETGSSERVELGDAVKAAYADLSNFRNSLGTSPSDPDPTTWQQKLAKLREVYDGVQAPPDVVVHWLLQKRGVRFFNGRGRYGVHPLAVEILREQLKSDSSYVYRGGGLDLPS